MLSLLALVRMWFILGWKVGGLIAERIGCSATWVRQIIHRFNRDDIDGITWYPYYCPRAGPRRYLADVTEQIAEVALSSPKALIGMSVWSLPKLRDYLVAQKTVASISAEALRQILKPRQPRSVGADLSSVGLAIMPNGIQLRNRPPAPATCWSALKSHRGGKFHESRVQVVIGRFPS